MILLCGTGAHSQPHCQQRVPPTSETRGFASELVQWDVNGPRCHGLRRRRVRQEARPWRLRRARARGLASLAHATLCPPLPHLGCPSPDWRLNAGVEGPRQRRVFRLRSSSSHVCAGALPIASYRLAGQDRRLSRSRLRGPLSTKSGFRSCDEEQAVEASVG
jgi:hypothetical protein